MLMVRRNPAKFIVSAERIKENPFYKSEMEKLADIVWEIFKDSGTVKKFVNRYDNVGVAIETEYNTSLKNHILVLSVEVGDWLTVKEESELKGCFEQCIEKGVRLMVEESFFDER